MEKIETKPFDQLFKRPETGGCSIALIGSTRSGKTTALTHIVNKYFLTDISCIFTNSLHAPIYKEIDTDIKSPVYLPRVVKDMYKFNKGTKNRYKFLCIFDDVVTGVKYDKELLKLLTIYRNSNINGIICSQAPTLMNAAARTNINYVMLFKLNSDEMIENVVKKYLNTALPGKVVDKMRLYKELTEDHHFFIINNLTGEVSRCKINVDDNK